MNPLARRIRTRIAHWLAPELQALAAVSVRVDDSKGWTSHEGTGPADRPWSDRAEDLDDAFVAWQKNFLVRRVVTLCRSYVIGDGIIITSKQEDVDAFAKRFWNHDKNRMDDRLAPLLNELIRAGEIFPTLHTNRADGMSYVRFVPAAQIREIKTADNDYELELEYGEMQRTTTELKWWMGPDHRLAYGRKGSKTLKPLMLHFAINREIGCTRGESDLTPLLPWAKRYTAWLQDRVRLNRSRTRQGIMDVKVAEDAKVEEKREQLRRTNPLEAGIYVHGPGEEVVLHDLNIGADDAKEDGTNLRLACGTAANVGLHYLGEGQALNYATAKEMGEPTARYYTERQDNLTSFLLSLISVAYHRYCALGHAAWPDDGDLGLQANTTEVARADNESLSKSASFIVRALVQMAGQGWVDDETATRLAFQFAGETLSTDEITAILAKAPKPEPEPEPDESSD